MVIISVRGQERRDSFGELWKELGLLGGDNGADVKDWGLGVKGLVQVAKGHGEYWQLFLVCKSYEGSCY